MAKRFMLVVYAERSTDAILEKIFEHMPDGTQYSKMEFKQITFISFFSNDKISTIRDSIYNLFKLPPLFFLFDISNRQIGRTFELHWDTLDKRILLDFDKFDDDAKLSIEDILELIYKNGFDSLTEQQIKIIEDYSQ